MSTSWPMLALTFALLSACTASGGAPVVKEAAEACTAATGAPVLQALVPDSAAAQLAQTGSVEVEARGCRFAPEANEVRFGPELLRGLPSSGDGTRIRFTAP